MGYDGASHLSRNDSSAPGLAAKHKRELADLCQPCRHQPADVTRAAWQDGGENQHCHEKLHQTMEITRERGRNKEIQSKKQRI